jgi:hypothetical protein
VFRPGPELIEANACASTPRVARPCIIGGYGEERGHGGKCAPIPSPIFPRSNTGTTGDATVACRPTASITYLFTRLKVENDELLSIVYSSSELFLLYSLNNLFVYSAQG